MGSTVTLGTGKDGREGRGTMNAAVFSSCPVCRAAGAQIRCVYRSALALGVRRSAACSVRVECGREEGGNVEKKDGRRKGEVRGGRVR